MRASVVIARELTAALSKFRARDGKTGRRIPVLCYHRVLPGRPEYDYFVTPEQFSEQMRFLSSEGFESLSMDDYLAICEGRRQAPERGVLVTFDDGYADNYLAAWPIARQFDVKLNLFVCTALISSGRADGLEQTVQKDVAASDEFCRPLSWEQLAEMKAAGVGIGLHGNNHLNWGVHPIDLLITDTEMGISMFKTQLCFEPRFFAFPYGHFGSYPEAAVSALGRVGFDLLFTTAMFRTAVSKENLLISRLVIHPEDDLDSFAGKLFGEFDWIGRARMFHYRLAKSLARPARVLRSAVAAAV